MPRVLFLMPTKTYRASAFLAAAERLQIDAVVGSDRHQALEEFTSGKTLTLDFYDVEATSKAIVEFANRFPLQAIIAVDDDTAVLAAVASEALSLPFNSPEAVRATREKQLMREVLAKSRVRVPGFKLLSTEKNPGELAHSVQYPAVLKPVFLAASRGVIRVDDQNEFGQAFDRIRRLLAEPDVKRRGGAAAKLILAEEYVPGQEVALEGLLCEGYLRVLAIFDKPDPLEGPYFEETIYVTPSRLASETQEEIADCVTQAAQALGLRSGPIHAELRVNEEGPWILEIAARSIGGLCARTLRFGTDVSLEELILRHALGMNIASLERESVASGVMMIPIPQAGILKRVRGLQAAKALSHVEDVLITIPVNQKVTPLPEGNRYLGFIFARAKLPDEVERAVRIAFDKLEFLIDPDSLNE